MQQGSWLDTACSCKHHDGRCACRGLDTCPQAAFTQFHGLIADELQLAPEQMLVCGMSLGWADPAAVENSLVSERAPVAEFTRFLED